MEPESKIIQVGTWLYDGTVEKSVRIIRQNWDYFYEEGYDDDPPDLNADGHAFYAVYGAPVPPEPGNPYLGEGYTSRSRTCLSREEAIELAEASVVGPISWGRLPTSET